jgi:hypothetical protein
MSFDVASAFELELVVPEGSTRHDLARSVAETLGASVAAFAQVTQVVLPPMPSGEIAAAVFGAARHHGAELEAVADDFNSFYLRHRASRIERPDGRTIACVRHENRLAGGERVAEIVTAPFVRAELQDLRAILETARRMGAEVPSGGELRLHLHADALREGKAFERLVEVAARSELGWPVLEADRVEIHGAKGTLDFAGITAFRERWVSIVFGVI